MLNLNQYIKRYHGAIVGSIRVTGSAKISSLSFNVEIDERNIIRLFNMNACWFQIPQMIYSMAVLSLFFMGFVLVVAMSLVVVRRLRQNRNVLERGNTYSIVDTSNQRNVSLMNEERKTPIQQYPEVDMPTTPPPYSEYSSQSYFTPNNPSIPSYNGYTQLSKN